MSVHLPCSGAGHLCTQHEHTTAVHNVAAAVCLLGVSTCVCTVLFMSFYVLLFKHHSMFSIILPLLFCVVGPFGNRKVMFHK